MRALAGDHAVAAGALGAEEGTVGALDERVDRLLGAVAFATPTDTLTRRHADGPQVEVADRLADPLPDLERHVRAGIPQEDRELLAADPGRDVLLADRGRDRAGDRA